MDGANAITYFFGDFCLDTRKRKLLDREGHTIALMPKAFDTLLYLVEHAGKTVEKDALMSAVWPDTIVEENNLSQNISLLRKALGDRPGDRRYIVTVPGRGFKFVEEVRREAPFQSEEGSIGRPVPEELRFLRPKRIGVLVIGLIAGLGILFLAYSYLSSPRQINSIAVMPFVNESGDPELEYLSEGMTQTLIDNLTGLQGLSVKPRSTVQRYKGKELDAPAIGRELGVDAVMFGWVTKRETELGLRIELVDARTGNNLWSQTYDRKVSNLVTLQGELTRNLIRSLSVKLSGADERKLTRKATDSAEAYQLYLNGQFHFRKLTPPSIAKAIALLQQAIAVDPSYALAYATLARAYVALVIAGEAHPGELLKAKAAAQKAIDVEPDLAEGHSVLAVVLAFYDWNWPEAENRFLRALELDANNASTHQGYGDFLGRMGRREEAIEQFDRALELEPFSPFMNAFAAIAQPNDEAAMQKVRFAIELEPDFYLPHVIAAQILRRNKSYPQCIEELRVAKRLSPGQTHSDRILAGCLVDIGKPEEARSILATLLADSATRFVPPVNIASVYDALGETDQALTMLEKGYEVRDPRMTFLKTQPVSASLREHPRFQQLLQRLFN